MKEYRRTLTIRQIAFAVLAGVGMGLGLLVVTTHSEPLTAGLVVCMLCMAASAVRNACFDSWRALLDPYGYIHSQQRDSAVAHLRTLVDAVDGNGDVDLDFEIQRCRRFLDSTDMSPGW